MPSRTIIKLNASFIEKRPRIERKIPKIYSLSLLYQHREEFTKLEFLSLAQTLTELDIYNRVSWPERNLLAPICHFYYGKNNAPILVEPNLPAILTCEEAFAYEKQGLSSALSQFLEERGINHANVAVQNFLKECEMLCERFNLCEDDILNNGSNIGWNNTLGLRIIDWGLTNDFLDNYYEVNGNEKVGNF